MSQLDETTAPAVEGESSAPAPRASIWHSLRVAREAQGLTVGEVAHRLKFTPKQVEAMEAGDIGQLPGAAFARGFMRNYARLLQLDPQPFIDALSEAVPVSDANVPVRHSSLGRMPQPGQAERSSMRALLVSLALLTLAFAGWYFGWLEPADEAELMEQAPSVVSDQGGSPAAVTLETVSTPVAQSLPEVAPSASAPQATMADASAPAASSASAPAASAPVAAPLAVPTPSASASAPATAVPAGYKRMVFSFAGDAWVEVRDGNGNVLHSRLNAGGTTQEVQGRPPFALVIGNAPQVKLSYAGREIDLAPHTRVMVARFSLE